MSRIRCLSAALAIAAGSLTLGACSGHTGASTATHTGPKTITVHGTMTLDAFGSETVDGVTCGGSDGYDDIVAGADITITDASGKVVGSGHLPQGSATMGEDDEIKRCVFDWKVKNVLLASKFYKVSIANRDAPTQTRKQMRHSVDLTF